MLTQLCFRGRVRLVFAFFAVMLLALPNLVNGQGANATLLGTVTDASGAVVPNA